VEKIAEGENVHRYRRDINKNQLKRRWGSTQKVSGNTCSKPRETKHFWLTGEGKENNEGPGAKFVQSSSIATGSGPGHKDL